MLLVLRMWTVRVVALAVVGGPALGYACDKCHSQSTYSPAIGYAPTAAYSPVVAYSPVMPQAAQYEAYTTYRASVVNGPVVTTEAVTAYDRCTGCPVGGDAHPSRRVGRHHCEVGGALARRGVDDRAGVSDPARLGGEPAEMTIGGKRVSLFQMPAIFQPTPEAELKHVKRDPI